MSQVSNHVKTYSKFILDHENTKWREFTGMCFLYGIQLDLSLEEIAEYTFETFHSMSIEEISSFFDDHKELKEDMILYFENK